MIQLFELSQPTISDCSNLVKQILNESIEQLDFRNNIDPSAKQINQFIEETTKNQVKGFVTPDMINGFDFVIVNAVYFKGQWVCDAQNNTN